MIAPLRSMRTRIVLMNTVVLAGLFGAIGASIPPLVRASMLRSIDRELEARTEGPPRGRGPMGRGMGPGREPFGRGPFGTGQMRPPDEPGSPAQPGQRRNPGAGPPNQGGRPDPESGPPQFGPDGKQLDFRGPDGRGGPPGGRFGPGPPEQVTSSGTVLHPRLIPLKTQQGSPQPPEPWDRAAFQRAQTGRRLLSTTTIDGEPMRIVSVPLPPNGPTEAVLQIPYPLAEVERAVTGTIGTLLMLAPFALIAAAFGGWALTGRALRPVARITSAAEEIGAEDLHRRIQIEGEDEFARLAATFNGMLERLDVAFADRERLIGELREMVERQRRFTADASHELKTPLTAIKANTSLLLSGSPTTEDYRESTREIDEAATAMSRLVQDLLLLARSDAGQLVREPAPLPLAEPVRRALEQTEKSAAAKISVDVDPGIVVRGDEDALARLFANLLDNAARHTPKGGSIAVRARRENGDVVVEVADTGSGIAPDHLPRLGERFYRIDLSRARSFGGTGLGLAICREIAAAHGGSLAIVSAVGKGTTVTVRLPLDD